MSSCDKLHHRARSSPGYHASTSHQVFLVRFYTNGGNGVNSRIHRLFSFLICIEPSLRLSVSVLFSADKCCAVKSAFAIAVFLVLLEKKRIICCLINRTVPSCCRHSVEDFLLWARSRPQPTIFPVPRGSKACLLPYQCGQDKNGPLQESREELNTGES